MDKMASSGDKRPLEVNMPRRGLPVGLSLRYR